MSKGRKKKKGIRFTKSGELMLTFQNRFRILIHYANQQKLGASPAISPYIITDALAHKLGILIPCEVPRERFDWLVEHLLLAFPLDRPTEKPKSIRVPTRAVTAAPLDDFYGSWEWRRTRMIALKRHGHRCQSCGATPRDMDVSGKPVRIVVDHIKPIRRFWDMRLDVENLQILCDECNMGKGSWDETDYRERVRVAR